MARPIKNNAEYFPHDADMRHDPRVRAVRRKFKLEGYAIYVMCIELLTDSDFFQFKTDPMNLEIIAGDFDCDVALLGDVIQYCIQLDLFQVSDSVLSCKSLENRFEGLLSKRERDRNRVFAADNTQSKVKQSKVENSKVNESIAPSVSGKDLDWFKKQINPIWADGLPSDKKNKLGAAIEQAFLYLSGNPKELAVADSVVCTRLVGKQFEFMKSDKPNAGKQPVKLVPLDNL